MDHTGFQMDSWDFPVDMVGASVSALADLCKEEITQAIDTSDPR